MSLTRTCRTLEERALHSAPCASQNNRCRTTVGWERGNIFLVSTLHMLEWNYDRIWNDPVYHQGPTRESEDICDTIVVHPISTGANLPKWHIPGTRQHPASVGGGVGRRESVRMAVPKPGVLHVDLQTVRSRWCCPTWWVPYSCLRISLIHAKLPPPPSSSFPPATKSNTANIHGQLTQFRRTRVRFQCVNLEWVVSF